MHQISAEGRAALDALDAADSMAMSQGALST